MPFDHAGECIAMDHECLCPSFAVVGVVEDLHVGVPDIVSKMTKRLSHVADLGEIGVLHFDGAPPDPAAHRLEATGQGVERLLIGRIANQLEAIDGGGFFSERMALVVSWV